MSYELLVGRLDFVCTTATTTRLRYFRLFEQSKHLIIDKPSPQEPNLLRGCGDNRTYVGGTVVFAEGSGALHRDTTLADINIRCSTPAPASTLASGGSPNPPFRPTPKNRGIGDGGGKHRVYRERVMVCPVRYDACVYDAWWSVQVCKHD